MTDETEITLMNYDWLVQNKTATIDWGSGSVVTETGGFDITELTRPGLTPAT